MFRRIIILVFLFCSIFILSCTSTSEKITNTTEYSDYLSSDMNEMMIKKEKENQFWKNKIEKAPNQYPYLSKLAAAQTQLFQATGKIAHLINAENYLKEVNKITNYNNSSYLRALARNLISQHRFKESLDLLAKAELNGEKLNATQKMLFDVHLELGNESEAEHYLNLIKDLSDFDYLIRFAKWCDHNGNLNNAITYFEMAKRIAESSKNKNHLTWIYSNLGDVYGHANRLKDSYQHYLKALELNPNDAYSKKGISWIIYSHERNPVEALRILNTITTQYNAPDYFLLKAEIAEFMDDEKSKVENLNRYLELVADKNYGIMYNRYNTLLLLDEFNDTKKASSIISQEIEQRPTPQSYDLLAWSYYSAGKYKKAFEIIEDQVRDKTFEPEIQYHMAEIYKANGMGKDAMKIKRELLESTYELGPLLSEKVKLL